MDTLLNRRSEDRQFLLSKNAALEREVEELKQTVAQLEGEFGVLLARLEALEWVTPSEYLSVENLLASGVDDVQEMDAEVAEYCVIVLGLGEANVTEDFLEDLIPASSTLFESVESLLKSKNVFVATDPNVARGWFHVDDFIFVEFAVEDRSDRDHPCDRGKGVVKVYSVNLGESLGD
ncbi:hypothetical protein BDM02DRAFT_3131544 [Thelephora ganbajun]|uniref:Uncharacterized protein n=1 Tax=Thelephora ganbajun TaxID=370292 RepID=A0ACB6Z5J5_THEGA|nr:hypothetical protein BDM02DRAFT_3131544 [Thelephora ganbajun]